MCPEPAALQLAAGNFCPSPQAKERQEYSQCRAVSLESALGSLPGEWGWGWGVASVQRKQQLALLEKVQLSGPTQPEPLTGTYGIMAGVPFLPSPRLWADGRFQRDHDCLLQITDEPGHWPEHTGTQASAKGRK